MLNRCQPPVPSHCDGISWLTNVKWLFRAPSRSPSAPSVAHSAAQRPNLFKPRLDQLLPRQHLQPLLALHHQPRNSTVLVLLRPQNLSLHMTKLAGYDTQLSWRGHQISCARTQPSSLSSEIEFPATAHPLSQPQSSSMLSFLSSIHPVPSLASSSKSSPRSTRTTQNGPAFSKPGTTGVPSTKTTRLSQDLVVSFRECHPAPSTPAALGSCD